ncbi:MAG: 2'-5' RNA ligase family protein [Promethearchaeota archaeon]
MTEKLIIKLIFLCCMNKLHTSAAVIIPPKDKWEPIQEIRRQYDHQINRWMPHISLIYPFRPESEYNTLEQEFSAVCKEIKPFEIKLKSFEYFNHGHQNFTLWIAPEPKDSIINLQKNIQMLVPECNDLNLYKNGFTPHLSVGQIKGKKLLLKIIQQLETKWYEIKFTLNKIYFIAREKCKKSLFRVKKVINFKN